MKPKLKKEWIRYFEYAGYTIYIYPKTLREKAIEFYLFDPDKKLTKETIWVSKSSIEDKRDGIEYYDIGWIFNAYKNQEKLEKIGYRL